MMSLWRPSFALAVLLATSCGYRFTPAGGPLPGGARALYVPVFKNATTEGGIEGYFTEALRDELARYGREGGPASDAEAHGTITSVSSGSAIVTSQLSERAFQTLSYRIQATVSVRVVRGGATLAETTVSGGEDYLPCRPTAGFECPVQGVGVLETEASRRMALRRLAPTLMRQAYQNLTGF